MLENRLDGVLVLFDVDKTLFMNSDPLMGQATTDAIETVWGRRLADDAIKFVDHPGQTATRLTRLLLRADGLPDEEIDSGMARWCKHVSTRYLELLSEADTSEWYASEGAAEAIAQIEHRALLTGNPEPVARARMELIGLNHLFPPGQGAFGCDAEDRPTLIDLARSRAGDWPREGTVAVGDTIADITGARAAGVSVIGFAPDGQLDELAGADVVIEKMAELPGALDLAVRRTLLRMRTVLLLLLGLIVGLLAAAPPALAHKGGKAEPRISAKATGTGFSRVLTIELTDIDDGGPIPDANVSVAGGMTIPHVMRLIPQDLPEVATGTYRGRYSFIMRGDWTVDIEVTGTRVVRATARLPIKLGSGTPTGGAKTTALPTRLETDVTRRDFLTMLVLWAHGLAAMGWIIGVIAMTIALSTQPLLAGPVRAGISAAYRQWGAWVHWSFVPVIVATGIYNMVYVTPFRLRWPWSSELDSIAYGNTYEAILLVKLGLFMVLLGTGTALLLRVTGAAPSANVQSIAGPFRTLVSALGAPGLVYVSTVPLILGAAMALRYVHIISHVAEVVNSR